MTRITLVLAVLLLALPWTAQAQPSFTGLGDLPGGESRSNPFGVSANGAGGVGRSSPGGLIRSSQQFCKFL